MVSWIAALLLIAISYGLLRFGLWIVRFYRNRQHQYAEAARKFNEEAAVLLAREDITSGDIAFIDDLVSTINDPRTAMVFYQVLYDKKRNRLEKPKRTHRTSDHLSEDHLNLHILWFTAVTAKSPIFGSMVRIAIAQQNIPTAVTEVSHRVHVDHKLRSKGRLAHA